MSSISGKVNGCPQLAGSWTHTIADDSVQRIRRNIAAGGREVGRKDRTQLNTCCSSSELGQTHSCWETGSAKLIYLKHIYLKQRDNALIYNQNSFNLLDCSRMFIVCMGACVWGNEAISWGRWVCSIGIKKVTLHLLPSTYVH